MKRTLYPDMRNCFKVILLGKILFVDPLSFECGVADVGDRIVGGNEVDPNSIPWQVLYLSPGRICGGTIISPYHIMTAAHCHREYVYYNRAQCVSGR